MSVARRSRRTPVVITRVQTGFCQIYATIAMPCPRCKVTVPAKTEHRCGTEMPLAPEAKILIDLATGRTS